MSETEIIVKMDKHLKLKGGSYVQDLVRCKDCKYSEERIGANLLYCILHSNSTIAEAFCSYGKRADT